ncbi:hypothetical protein [Tenacibaculum sp. 190524A02b]|uniref:Uncharacterized protein n=1 Tax=Tenacibaculum vairaonense TaxID=3137860 RepID=A0ABP1FC38_9FLAO
MPPITVNVGEILEVNQNNEIRTRGCDPCVGLIVIYDAGGGNLIKRCAHFTVNFAGPYTQDRIDQALNPILNNFFQPIGIISVGYTWGGGAAGMGSNFICNNLDIYFADFNPVSSNNNDSITSNGANVQLLNNQHWAFTNIPPLNNNADLN